MTDPVFLFDPDTDDVPVNGDGLNVGWTITLPASVKRHALGAMRLAEGDGLSLTDGRGLCVKTTLVDAQEHPERHRDLVVRVAGYSALFVELSRTLQDDIINRTEHVL